MNNKNCKALTYTFILNSIMAIEGLEASKIKVIDIVPELDSREVVLGHKKDTPPLIILPTVLPGCESKDAPLCQTNIASICNPSQNNFAEFLINSEQIHGHQHFAINGNSGGIFFGGSCRNLNTSKDYQITFLNDDIGTTCISEEIKPALFSSVFVILKEREDL